MNQKQLVAAVSESAGVSKKDTEAVLKSLGAVSISTLKDGGDIALPGIGKLSVKTRAARTGHNPRTGDSIAIPAKVVPHFSAAKSLKDGVA